jgi:hypothetical protein
MKKTICDRCRLVSKDGWWTFRVTDETAIHQAVPCPVAIYDLCKTCYEEFRGFLEQ